MKVLILVTVLIGVILMIPEGQSQSDLPELEEIEASADQILDDQEEQPERRSRLLENFKTAADAGLKKTKKDAEKLKNFVGNVLSAAKGKWLGRSSAESEENFPAEGSDQAQLLAAAPTATKQQPAKGSSVKQPSSAAFTFKGGCNDKPPTPANSNVKCSTSSGCEVKCLENYSLPDKTTTLSIRCEDGSWKMGKWDRTPDCEPICSPPCQNLGFCIAPNVCSCPSGFEGAQCQTAKSKPCLDKPPTPMNSRVVCNEKECTATCNKGFSLPNNEKKLVLVCSSGLWVQQSSTTPTGTFKKVPDCLPVCDPPCENGGRCLPNNICECPQQFRGAQCKYPLENCLPERLNFNGGYNCSSKGSMAANPSFSCSLNCGGEGEFEFPPAPVYTCLYAEGRFTPEPIPQCVFESDQVQYVSSNSSTRSEMVVETEGSQLTWGRLQKEIKKEEEREWSWISGSEPVDLKSSKTKTNTEAQQKYFEGFFNGNGADYGQLTEEFSTRETKAKPGTCLAWGKVHVKTFDGKVYSFQSDCSYVLLRDAAAATFSVVYGYQKGCKSGAGQKKGSSPSSCKRTITVYVEDFTYELDTRDNGEPILRKGEQSVVIPSSIDGMLTERVAGYVVLRADGLGFTLKWDTKTTLMLDVSEALWNRTTGLCGRINGFWSDDFENRDGSRSPNLLGFVNSWEADSTDDGCVSGPNDKHACSQNEAVSNAATRMCDRLLKDPKFNQCRKVLDPKPYYEACRWDYCQCGSSSRESCACSALETYFHECLRLGVQLPQEGWRDPSFCPISCDQGKVYKLCGPIADETCSSAVSNSIQKPDFCVEGCYCPPGSVIHQGRCVPRSSCPCTHASKVFQPGQEVANDCNTCTCVAGQWQCTELRCGVRCAVLGDPHYTTFDGLHYDFMGKCSYYLMKGSNYSVEAENVPCSGAVSEAMNFPIKSLSGVPSCTKSVTIRWNSGNGGRDVIKLRPNRDVLVNGDPPAVLPLWMDGIVIRHASSAFVSVELPNGLEIWWDGFSRVYIDAPPAFYGNTQGLCGTFNENQRDDLRTLEGDIEESVPAFANGWKTSETCQDADDLGQPPHPCDVNPHHRAKAQKACSKIRDALFQSCHHLVDPEQFYLDCLYDVCACEGVKLGKCLCPAIASYAKECSQKGAIVDWIPDVRECGVQCPGGQIYQVCGNSCTRTCYDISTYPKCRRKCVEGCNCPEGQTLDPFGRCIPVGQCPCLHKGVEYLAGHKELRPGVRSPDLCTCISARWSCRPATEDEQRNFNTSSASLLLQCRTTANEEFTTCEPEVQLTCKTMHEQVSLKKPSVCRPGCRCKKGYVLDSLTKKCIKPSECPCHHGGKSYSEGHRISQDCNSCTCQSGKWECTKNQCPGICTNWGESHFKTFDGKTYDFHGHCDYMLAKGVGSEPSEKFQVTIQSVPCGSSGVACAKAITLRLPNITSNSAEESITLGRHKEIPLGKFTSRITVREAGLFIFIEVADLGLVLQWDHGTRVYLRLDPKWKGRVRGLCGNFNDNALDDFQPPSGGGLVEVDVKTFGDSWRLQNYCPETEDYIDTCTLHPQRKVWSVMKCNMLKSTELFGPCHAHVPVDYFVDRCVLDSCGCDMGGDCECLCTSFAAYAHECNLHGVPIKWRSQELCPLQCDEECSSYTPCMSTCPPVSCDNPLGATLLCPSDSCVEGCLPQPCPKGQIHRSIKHGAHQSRGGCVSVADCPSAICLELDGVLYAEGDLMEKDACHACYCSKGKRICQGQPCKPKLNTTTTISTTTPISSTKPSGELRILTTTPSPFPGTASCRTGWSNWINTHQPGKGDPNDYEFILDYVNPSLATAPSCKRTQMVDIECRTSESQIPHKKTGDDVDCSLIGGLRCVPGGIKGRSSCLDYEIRVLCDCSASQELKISTTRAPVTTKKPGPADRCDPARPHIQHPTSCYLFYHCVDRPNGIELVEKTCNPPTMFNPITMICDWPDSVMKIRPDCGHTPTTTSLKPTITTTKPISTTTSSVTSTSKKPSPADRCDPARPHIQHPTSCYLFYHCVDRLNAIELVEKTCNHPTMFNPITMVCDWPDSVMKIRPECGHSPTTTTVKPTSTTVKPTTIKATKPTTDQVSIACVDGWTDWFNVSHPASGNKGEFELYDTIATRYPVCSKSHIKDIECMYAHREVGSSKTKKTGSDSPGYSTLKDYRTSPDRSVTCTATEGLTCRNSDQITGVCQDYTVRFLCGCQDEPRKPDSENHQICPAGFEWDECAYRCDQLCMNFHHVMQEHGYCPSTLSGCAPGCVEVETQQQKTSPCPLGSYWRDEQTCVPISDCNCRSPLGEIMAPGSTTTDEEDPCQLCQCLDNEYVCDQSGCTETATFKYATVGLDMALNVSVKKRTTPRPRPTIQTKPPGPTASPPSCTGWSNWINENQPTASGEKESKALQQLQSEFGFCLHGGLLTDIECRDAKTNQLITETQDKDVICTLKDGLSCSASRQGKGGRCQDYKIRYFCQCSPDKENLIALTTTTSKPVTTPSTTTIMIWTTASTKPLLGQCSQDRQIPILSDPNRPIPDSAFKSTSSLSAETGPQSARLTGRAAWVAAKTELDQHVQVDLGRPTRLDGLIIGGHPTAKQFVTSLFVLHSTDNQRFAYVADKAGKPMLFRGPLEHSGTQRHAFEAPVEARYVRLEPQTWKHAIALQFELLGCVNMTIATTRKPVTHQCTDRMGMEVGRISDDQISFSSVLKESEFQHGIEQVRLDHGGVSSGWRPAISSRQEWLRVDLLEPRNLSGLLTQGGNGNAWVESFIVRYSSDGESWSTILNDEGGQRVFPANVDGQTVHTTYFDRLIRARYIKIVPWTWHGSIALRLEVLGCYVQPVVVQQTTTARPSTTTATTTTTTTTTKRPELLCNPCPNIPPELLNLKQCLCPPGQQRWNGTGCVASAGQCPCVDGHVRYPVGAIYQRLGDCSHCVCQIGGKGECRPPVCPPCSSPGMRSVLSASPQCQCSCQPCPSGTRLCSSNNQCMDESLWCNGVEDCPGDESNCVTTTPEPIECAITICAEGYQEELVQTLSPNPCPVYQCVPDFKILPEGQTCPIPECPPEYTLEVPPDYDDYDGQQQGQQQHLQQISQLSQKQSRGEEQSKCPPYKCIPPPEPTTTTTTAKPAPIIEGRKDRCSLTSRILRTFDGSEFSYDICHHILVRDKIDKLWTVSIHKNCSNLDMCTRSLRIQHGKGVEIGLLPQFRVAYNKYEYDYYQAEEIAENSKGEFSLQRIGDTVLFTSNKFGFWVVYDSFMNVKIGVTWKLINKIEGLCGLYNVDPSDDHTMPSTGQLASTAAEFGSAWTTYAHFGPPNCGPPAHCLIATQTTAWEKCGAFLRQEPFSRCHKPAELDQAVFRCVDAMCDCVASTVAFSISDAVEQCTCQVMGVMAGECHDDHLQKTGIDLSGWRSKYDCPVTCPSPGMIHRECNDRRHCEATCSNRKGNPTAKCPADLPKLCYPGCVCPDGLVRRERDNKCVKPAECRDCVCQGFGDPHYVTFDGANFTLNGQCTFVAARDSLSNGESNQIDTDHDFQVLVTNKECQEGTKTTCTEAVTILYQDHRIELRRSEPTLSVLVSLDGILLDAFPVYLPWIRMEKLPGTEEVSVLLLAIQVEVSYYWANAGFKVRLPSQTYLNKTEGLCGNCNDDVKDDLYGLENQIDRLGLNWAVTKLLEGDSQDSECGISPKSECTPLHPDVDPCFKLVTSDIFKECNAVVDPLPYLSACQYDVCKSNDPKSSACRSMEAYARDCGELGICLPWRSKDLCPVECPLESGMEYRQCGSGCLNDCSLHQTKNRNSEDSQLSLSNCPMSTADGCYCPDDEAYHKDLGRCVPVDHCRHCDVDGHLRGEQWSIDECTNCTCESDSGRVLCQKNQCVLDECLSGRVRRIIDPKPGDCCPTVVCLESEPQIISNQTSCPSVPAPLCGANQVLRYQDIKGCPRQVCECVPASQCPQLTRPAVLPGEIYYVNNRSGCCPRLERICATDQCKPKPDCPPFYSTELVPQSDPAPCCPQYRCTPPTDVCIYEHSNEGKSEELRVSTTTASPKPIKGRKKRSVQLPHTSVVRRYKINATWTDGPCVSCVCEYDEVTKTAHSVCTTQQCPSPDDDADYVLKSSPPAAGECCPRLTRSACMQETRIYQAGEVWPAPGGDPCKSYKCVRQPDNSVVKQLQVAECKSQCPAGWRYRPANATADGGEEKCCGECIQVACTARDGREHKLGREWKPDPCTTAICVERANKLLQVETTKETCQEPSADEKALFVYQVIPAPADRCCPTHRKTACLVNNVIRKGDSWISEEDPCITFVCADEGDGELVHQKTVRTCPTDCPEGYEYQPSLHSSECCGRCVQTACLLDGQAYAIGSTWRPDPCTSLSCTEGGQLIRAEVMCVSPPDCPPENLVVQPGECCATCNATQSLTNCLPEAMPLKETVGLVRSGACTNIEPIPGLTQCKGLCPSGTYHDSDVSEPMGRCECCSATETSELEVLLVCNEKSRKEKKHTIRIATKCSCNPCSGMDDLGLQVLSLARNGRK